ncbi:MAG: NusG domain II-containing protein [Clostridia bacterium]|nr:NusG domain II-containing protein [Clostridia bacterium]
MKKSTKILATCFSVAAIAAAAGIIYLNNSSDALSGKYACIFENGELVQRIDLTSIVKPHKIELGGNVILVENGRVSMVEADCPDKLCIKQGAITNGARPIVCLPNNVVIKITDDITDVDITVGA